MSVQFITVSWPSTGRNQDCGILVLQQFLGNHGIIVEYNEIISKLNDMYRDFGIEYDANTCQLTADAFEGLLSQYLPNHEIELYNVIQKPNQVIDVVLKMIGRGNPIKTEYRIALKSSWDHSRKTVGAGHFVLLNTRLATSDQIIRAIQQKDFTETTFRIGCLVCSALTTLACANCAAPYCNTKCQTRDWSNHQYNCKK